MNWGDGCVWQRWQGRGCAVQVVGTAAVAAYNARISRVELDDDSSRATVWVTHHALSGR